MHRRVAIYFARRGMKNLRPHAFGQSEHVQRTVYRSFQRFDRIILVIHGRCGTGEVIYFVYLGVIGRSHIMPHGLKTVVAQQMTDIVLVSRKIIVEANHIVTFSYQSLAQMRTDKPGAPGH